MPMAGRARLGGSAFRPTNHLAGYSLPAAEFFREEVRLLSILPGQGRDVPGQRINPIIEVPPIPGQILDQVDHAWREHVRALGQKGGQGLAQAGRPLSDRDAAFEQEAADLVDHRRALPDQTAAHPVQGLQIELLRRLQGHRAHGGPLRRLGDGLGVAVIVLVPLEEWFDILGRQKVDVMAQSGELSPDVMGARASLHADQADRHIGQAGQ